MSITVIYHTMYLTVLYQYHQDERYIYHSDLSRYVSDYCISITKKSDTMYVYHSDLSRYVSDCTVSVSPRWVIHLSQWFITLCLWLYCISIIKKSDTSITVIYHAMSLTTVSVSLRRVIQCMSITVIYHAMSLTVLYQYHQDEWYVYHSDLSCYVSDCTVSVSPRWVIRLSQWFITLCLWLYCISITKKSDTSITVVIYHAMSLTTVSVSPRWVIRLSQWFITLCLWLLYQYHQDEWYLYHNDLSRYVSDYCINITKKSDISITMIYHTMSLTTVSVSPRRVISLSQWFITLCLWLLYQYH
jgi:hypothetical protein